MDKRTRKTKNKNKKMRCALSGKIINGNKEVVLVENAVAYVRKMGFLVSNVKFLFAILFFGLMLFSVSALTYQEDSNASAYEGYTGWITPANVVDGDWGTYSSVTGPSGSGYGYYYLNYTKPEGANSSSFWSVKDGVGSENLTIPSDCWTSDETTLRFKIRATLASSGQTRRSYWYCYNSTGEDLLRFNENFAGVIAYSSIYEEGVWWDIEEVGCSEDLQNNTLIDWQNYESCLITDEQQQNRTVEQYDANECGTYENETFVQWQNISCNYCSYSLVNNTLEDWFDVTNCTDGSKTQNMTIETYDENNATCYAVTGLSSDAFNDGSNMTYYLQQDVACADVSVFEIDFDLFTGIVFFCLFALSCLLIFFRLVLFGGGLMALLGFTLLFSGFNPVLSFILIVGGVLAIFTNK